MALSRRSLSLLTACLLAAWCAPVAAEQLIEEGGQQDLTPRPQRVFTEKPRIEDYSDYSAFLVDIMEYRRQKEEAAAARNAAPPPVTTPGTVDPALYQIDGPEDLEEALARARKLPHPVYQEPERYGRTTSSSFPIPELAGTDLSDSGVEGSLADLESVSPPTYTELDDIEQNVVVEQGREPTKDADARERQADKDSVTSFQVAFDRDSRVVSDSLGNRYTVPQSVKNEVNYTIINRAEFSAQVVKH